MTAIRLTSRDHPFRSGCLDLLSYRYSLRVHNFDGNCDIDRVFDRLQYSLYNRRINMYVLLSAHPFQSKYHDGSGVAVHVPRSGIHIHFLVFVAARGWRECHSGSNGLTFNVRIMMLPSVLHGSYFLEKTKLFCAYPE